MGTSWNGGGEGVDLEKGGITPLQTMFYYQHYIDNYTDQVLNFLLFDRHDYIHTESSGL